MKPKGKYRGKVLMALTGLWLIAACGGNYPLRADAMVGRAFWNGIINPGLNYYSFGPARGPEVIIGVDRNLVFQNSSMWQSVSPLTPEHLSALAQSMSYRTQPENMQVQGCNMFDDKGRWVGQWYSPADVTADIYSRGRDRVFISPPSPNPDRPLNVPWAIPPGQYR